VTTWFNVDFITVKNLESVMTSMFHFISGNTVNMAGVSTLKDVYNKQMFYNDSNSNQQEIANPDESGNKRLTKWYFEDSMYSDSITGVPNFDTSIIRSGFIKNDHRNDIISLNPSALTTDSFKNKTKEHIFATFEARLASNMGTGSQATTFQNPSRETILTFLTNATYSKDTAFSAWKHIDIMFPVEERGKYGFIHRLYTLTKFVFMLKVLDPTKVNTANKPIALALCEELILHLYKDILQFTTIGDGTSGLQIDDVYADNTKLTHDIRNNSETLIKNKDRVTLTQNNLRSLANLERHVQKTRNLTWYMMIALLVVLVVAGASLMYSYARGMTGEVYLVAIIIVTGVFSFEAFRGAERIFSLPPSTFE
jgi:hypothetical protein